jgi:hypothetical protein
MDTKTQKNLMKYGGYRFDFSEINDEHKRAVKEVCEILKQQGVEENVIKELQLKFKIKKLPTYDISESPFVQYCKKNNIVPLEQGNVTVKENNETKLYPIIAVCEDIRKINILFDDIFNSAIKVGNQIKK